MGTKTVKEHVPDIRFLNVNTLEIYKELGEKRLSALAASGGEDAGKIWLLEKLAGVPSGAGVRTTVIKHDGYEFEADIPDTDSFRMRKTGTYGTMVYSGNRFSLVKDQPGIEAGDLFVFFPEMDLILLEGREYSSFPKIEVLRAAVSSEPTCDPQTVLAYVSDMPPKQGKVFPFDSIDETSEVTIGWMDRKC